MAGPNINGWRAATITPKTADLPISPAAVQRIIAPGGKLPAAFGDREATTKMQQERLAKLRPEADALEAAGDQKSLEKALDLRKKIAILENSGTIQGGQVLDQYKNVVNAFKTKHPEYKLTPQEEHGLSLDFSGADQAASTPALASAAMGIPTAASSGSSDLSRYELQPSDFGFATGPDPRAAAKKQTPLEQLLATLSPQAAAAPMGSDPLADPRALSSGGASGFNSLLASLVQPQQAAGVAPAPMAAAPAAVGPSFGANLAATIPGAPPFLAGAINNMQAFNPYAQAPVAAAPQPAARGMDLTGLAALSAEQRIQQAELAKNKAAAQAKWFASQAKQEQMRSEQENLNRLKGFGASGWTGPAMPTY